MIIVDLDDYGVSLKPENNTLYFGYTLKSDSIKECYDFYCMGMGWVLNKKAAE